MTFLFQLVDRRYGPRNITRPKKPHKITCERCGIECERKGRAKYCESCAEVVAVLCVKDKPPRENKRHFEITCIDCGKTEIRKLSTIKRCIDCANKKDKADQKVYRAANRPQEPKPKGRPPRSKRPEAPKTTFFCVTCKKDLPLASKARTIATNGRCIACEKRIARSIKAKIAQPKKQRRPLSEHQINQLCRWVDNHGG